MDSPDDTPSIRIRRLTWGIIIALNLIVLEYAASLVCGLLLQIAVFYYPDVIERNIPEYLEKRHPTLGWTTPKSLDGTRTDHGPYANASRCVDTYGDSFTYGIEVSDEAAWPAVLSKKLQCRVRNFGVGGYGTDQALMRYRRASESAPIIMLGHYSHNIIRNVNQFRNLLTPNIEIGLKPRFLLDEEKLIEVPLPEIPIKEYELFFSEPERYLHHEYFLPEGNSGTLYAPSFPYLYHLFLARNQWRVKAWLKNEPMYAAFYSQTHPSGALALSARILDTFYEEVRAQDKSPVIVFLPDCYDLLELKESGHTPYEPLIAMLSNKEAVLDLAPLLLNRTPDVHPLYTSCGKHFSKQGNEIVAELLANYVSSKNLLHTARPG